MINVEYLNSIPLVDTHVHRIHPNRSPEFGCIAGGYIKGPNQEYNARQTLLYGRIIEKLRNKFNLSENLSMQDVEEYRMAKYKEDPQAYFKALIKDQNVSMFCLEIGSPIGGPCYTPEEKEYFHRSIPESKSCAIVRFERVFDDLLATIQDCGFDEFIKEYDKNLRKAISSEKTVGLKSCAAYYGGLNVQDVDKRDAEKAFTAISTGTATLQQKKTVNNYILFNSIDTAVEFDLPIQIHTGAGGGSWLDFKSQNPINLIDFLQDKRVKDRAKIVLLHGGHPHEEDCGYLASQFSNVYTDFSGAFYLNTVKSLERMLALIEKLPLNKVMFGSDGVMFPEVFWFAYDYFREQLARMLNYLIENQWTTQRRAEQIAKMIMNENALECYENIKKYT